MEQENINTEEAENGGAMHHDRDFDMTLIIVFIGFLGIAILMWFIMSDDSVVKKKINTIVDEVEQVEDIQTDVSTQTPTEVEKYADVEGRNTQVLGLTIHPTIGKYYTKIDDRMTLYTATKECTGSCRENFTPYLAEEPLTEVSTDLGTITLSDGTIQYTLRNLLLYTYNGDAKAGEVIGDGFDTRTFLIARP